MLTINEPEALELSTLFNIDELEEEIKYWNKEKFLLPFGFYLNYYGHKKSLIKYFILMASFLIIFLTATILGPLVIPLAGQIASLALLGGLISFVFFLPSMNSKIKNHITKEEIERRLEALKSELETEKQNLLNLDKSNKSTNQIITEKEKQPLVISSERINPSPVAVYKPANTFSDGTEEIIQSPILKRER